MTNDRITGPCPECERTRAANARLKSERPYMVDRPYEDLTRLEALRTRIAELEAEVARLQRMLAELDAELANSCNAEELYQTRKSNSRLQAEVTRLRNAALYTMGRLQMDIDSGDRPDQWSMQDMVNKHRAALEVKP